MQFPWNFYENELEIACNFHEISWEKHNGCCYENELVIACNFHEISMKMSYAISMKFLWKWARNCHEISWEKHMFFNTEKPHEGCMKLIWIVHFITTEIFEGNTYTTHVLYLYMYNYTILDNKVTYSMYMYIIYNNMFI